MGRSAFYTAAEQGHHEVLRLLLPAAAEAADAAIKQHTNAGALHAAAANGHDQVVLLLLAAGAFVNARTVDTLTSLHAAAAAGHPRVVQLLLEAGARVNAIDFRHSTPLHKAGAAGSQEAVQLLLEAGGNVHAVDSEGYTPLHTAARSTRGTNAGVQGGQASSGVVQLLLAAGARVGAEAGVFGHTALFLAAGAGHHDSVRLLLAAGADVNVSHPGPLCLRGNLPVRRPLYAAAAGGHLEVVQLLLGANADTSASFGLTPLYEAAKLGHYGIVQLLLAPGADVNAVNPENGWTALYAAVDRDHHAVVQLLLHNGASPQLPCTSCHEPIDFLSVAIVQGHKDTVQLLLEAWGQPQVPLDDLVSAAQLAAQAHRMPVFALLANELRKRYPAELQRLFEARPVFHRVDAAAAVAAVLEARATDVSSFDVQRAALCKREQDVASEQQAVQQLVVAVAGMAKSAQQRRPVSPAGMTQRMLSLSYRLAGWLKFLTLSLAKGQPCGLM